MAKSFLCLSASERQEIFKFAIAASGRAGRLLEKDVWGVWAIRELFAAPFETFDF